jgi:ATPase subunit of ABC transporter with duplicated ATPase domains
VVELRRQAMEAKKAKKQETKEKAKREAKEAREAEEKKKRKAKEAKEREKREAKEAKEKAKREAKEAKEKAKREAKAAKEAKKKGKKAEPPAARPKKAVAEGVELYQGMVTLSITPPVDPAGLDSLKRALLKVEDLRVVMVSGAVDEGSRVLVSAAEPLPLLSILRGIPAVSGLAPKGDEIEVSLKVN